MTEPVVRVEGLDQLLRKLARLGPSVYRPAVAEAATHVKDVIAVYPPQRRGKQPPKTMKQFIFLTHAIPNGLIDYPYRRGISRTSEALGRRWTIEYRNNGLTAIVGNNASYVRWVHDGEDQSFYHKTTGWKTDKQVVREEAREVKEILARHVQNALRRR